MNVLVTGGTGTLGREVVHAVTAAGHRAVTMSRTPAPDVAAAPRWATADIVTGQGLAAAVADMDAIIHAASDPRGDPAADEEGTRRLAEAARAARVRHLVFVSIVGIDRIPFPYYARKLAAERALAASGQPYSILRATQFHSFVNFLFGKAATAMPFVMPLPAGYHVQSVGLEDVAARLLRAIDEGPRGLLPDFGGPERMTAREAARIWQQARGVRKPIVPFFSFSATSRGFRGGYNTLPADTPPENRGQLSWREWLARPIATRPY
ncbi:MAG TPA: NAD(P)H-binding protein [Vicinamibacterales bacterium]|nr:NAD(P)H-binding protein [Vicinamibacterales bacterium]